MSVLGLCVNKQYTTRNANCGTIIHMKNKNNIRGFTLIEMLVVIAIITILSGIIITNMSGAKGKARDTKRISDMGNLQMALELYFDRCNKYPPVDTVVVGGVGQGVGSPGDCDRQKTGAGGGEYSMADFIDPIPTPSVGGHYEYAVSSTRTDYVLHTVMESPNSAGTGGLVSTPTLVGGAFTCNETTAGLTNYCVGPK